MSGYVAVLLGTVRPSFLLLTPVSVFLGVAAAGAGGAGAIPYGWVALTLVGAALAHASVNMLNEYEDFRSGLDFQTRRTPFSGGSGTLVERPHGARTALGGGVVALLGTAVIGCVLIHVHGWGLLPLGVLGILSVVAYSRRIVRWPLASLLVPGLGFGPLMVLGTAFVVAGAYTATALVASLVPFCLVNGLLLLNQFPDVAADRAVGRRNLPILIGRRASAVVFGGLLLAAFATVIAGMVGGWLPPVAAIALAPGLAAPLLSVRVYRHADDPESLRPLMGWNVMITLVTPALLGVALLAG